MVYVSQMFFSWDRRSQGTFPAVTVVKMTLETMLECWA